MLASACWPPGARAGSLDRLISSVTVGVYSVPEFALAVLLIAVFGCSWAGCRRPRSARPDLLAQPAVLVLPLLVLLARPICSLRRLVRAGMVDALASAYVRHARRYGIRRPGPVRPRPAERRRPGRAAARPHHRLAAGRGDRRRGGVRDPRPRHRPGGRRGRRDLPVVQGLAVVFAVTTVVVNLGADLVAFRLAPRAEVVA